MWGWIGRERQGRSVPKDGWSTELEGDGGGWEVRERERVSPCGWTRDVGGVWQRGLGDVAEVRSTGDGAER